MQGFAEWTRRHCTIFGLFDARQVEMVASWQEIFDGCGFTAAELNAATTWLAGNDPPRFPSEHLAALSKRVREARAEETPEQYVARQQVENAELNRRLAAKRQQARRGTQWEGGGLMQPNQLPQQNLDAERSVLGSMLRDNDVIDDVLLIVVAEDFYTDAHQRIFRAIADLHTAGGKADLVTLAEELERRRETESVGGPAAIGQLWDAAPTAANVVYYAKIVKDKSVFRRLGHAANEIAKEAYNPTGTADDALELAERAVFSIAETAIASDVADAQQAVSELFDYIDACKNYRGAAGSIKTGFIDLDKKTGGLHPSSLALIAARPSVGKTALGAAVALRMILQGHPVFFASLEQTRLELTERMACAYAKVDSHLLREGLLDNEESRRLVEAGNEIRLCTLEFADSGRQTVLQIAAKARRMKRRKGLAAVFIDYLQLIEPSHRQPQRYQEVGCISRGLKAMAKELAVPVVCMCQLNRASEDRTDKRPRLSDLRESGSLEMDADVVVLMHRSADNDNVIELNVAKNRNGPTGTVKLTFLPAFTRFENYAEGIPLG